MTKLEYNEGENNVDKHVMSVDEQYLPVLH